MFDEMYWVNDPTGGWRRPEDWCNSGPKGTGIHWTSSAVEMQEELFGACELGDRVADEFVGLAVDGWGALMDAIYDEDMRRQSPEAVCR